jgi:hypothetical protein
VSDLSRLLGDVYGASTPSPADELDAADPTTPSAVPAADDPPGPPVEAAARTAPAAPRWADEDVLDEAFAEWVPGPPPDASAEERGMLADVEPAERVAEPIDIDAWLGTDVDDEVRFVDESASEAAAPVDEHADVPWTRTSDDLLPQVRRGRRLNLSLRR